MRNVSFLSATYFPIWLNIRLSTSDSPGFYGENQSHQKPPESRKPTGTCDRNTDDGVNRAGGNSLVQCQAQAKANVRAGSKGGEQKALPQLELTEKSNVVNLGEEGLEPQHGVAVKLGAGF